MDMIFGASSDPTIWQTSNMPPTNSEIGQAIGEINNRGIFSLTQAGTTTPIFILDMDLVRSIFPKKNDSALQQFVSGGKEFVGNIIKILTFKPVSEFPMTLITINTHLGYWITTQHPEWFSLAGMDTFAVRPNVWREYTLDIYTYFSKSEIVLSNTKDIISTAELLIGSEIEPPMSMIKYPETAGEIVKVENNLYEQFKETYTLEEVKAALYLAVAKNWILWKKISLNTGKWKSPWNTKYGLYGFVDQYAFYGATIKQYRKYLEVSERLKTRTRIIECLFSVGVNLIIAANLAPKALSALAAVTSILTPEEEEELTTTYQPPSGASNAWIPLVGAAVLAVVALSSD